MNKDKLILIVAGVSGILAFVLFWQQTSKSKLPAVPVVVAKAEILQGMIIAPEMLTMSPPAQIRDTSDFYLNPADAVGMKTKKPVSAGKAVLRSAVQDPMTSDASLKFAVPAGMVVVTFTNRDIENPPAFLTVGNYVDILGLASREAANQTVLVQSVQIVDMERNKDESFKSLSVAMTPVEAEAAAGATKLGQIRLALRLEPLMKGTPAPATIASATTVKSMEVIRGSLPPVRAVFGAPDGYADPSMVGAVPSQPPAYMPPTATAAPAPRTVDSGKKK